MANKLTRIEIDSGMKEFIPKTGFTGDDLKQIGKKSKLKPSITIRRLKLKDNFVPGTPSQEVESEFGIKIGEDQQGFFFKKTFKRGGDVMPARNKKNFRPTKAGAGMTKAGVAAYRRANPGSKLKTAVTGKVKPGSKDAKRRKSFCARSLGQMKKFPKAAKNPNSRLRQARRRWKC
jgi:hypothetical protein